MALLHMHTVGKEREKVPYYALIFKYALQPLAYMLKYNVSKTR